MTLKINNYNFLYWAFVSFAIPQLPFSSAKSFCNLQANAFVVYLLIYILKFVVYKLLDGTIIYHSMFQPPQPAILYFINYIPASIYFYQLQIGRYSLDSSILQTLLYTFLNIFLSYNLNSVSSL